MPLFVNLITVRIAARALAIVEQSERLTRLKVGTTLSRS